MAVTKAKKITKKPSKKTKAKKTIIQKAPTKKAPPKKTKAKKTIIQKAPTKKAPPKKTKAKKTSIKKVKKASASKKTKKSISVSTVATNKSKIAPYKPKKNEKYMSAAMKKHFIAVLLLWKEHLKEEMQKTFDHLRTKGETYADPIDRASQEEEFAFELRTRDRERKLINKIAISIEQIKQDEYGWCESCGDEIGIKRLEARPTATHCIDCKTLDEIKEKQLNG